MNVGPYFMAFPKESSKLIKDLNISAKMTEILEENLKRLCGLLH